MNESVDLVGKIILWLLLPLCLVAIMLVAKDSSDKSSYCREKGGVPVTDRGVYKACAKPDSYILLESDK